MTIKFIDKNELIIGSSTIPEDVTFRFSDILRIGGGGDTPSWQDIVLTGNGSLTLTNAKANGLNYLKLFGACEQNGTPTPDTPVDIVSNNGVIKARHQSGLPLRYRRVSWLRSTKGITITGFKTKDTQNIKAKWMKVLNYSQYLYFSDTTSSGTTNTTAYLVAGATGMWRFDGAAKGIAFSNNVLYETVQNKNGVRANDEQVAEYKNVSSFTSSNDLTIFSNASFGSICLYSLQNEENGIKTLDIIPVQDVIDNTYGVYDLVNGIFYTNAEAEFLAGNTVDDPIEIYTDGTVETVEVTGRNLFDIATQTISQGAISSSNGANSTSNFRVRTDYLAVQPNTEYTVSADITGYTSGTSRGVFVLEYIADSGDYVENFVSGSGSGWKSPDGYTFTTGATTKAIRIVLAAGATIAISPSNINWVQLEHGDTATTYEPYYNGGSATAEMLLSVGDYKDVQNVTTGEVIRNCEAVYYDGTQTINNPYISTTGGLNVGSIIVHPKTTPTTESVTHQPLSIQAGTNIIEITQASIDNLPLEVSYKGTV